MSDVQAIIRKTHTVSLTFTGKPDAGTIKTMKTAGFKYENGNWYSSQTDSHLIREEEVAIQIAA